MTTRISVQANGLTFDALVWEPKGATDAPLALLVHGYPDTAWTWRHLGPYLAERGWRAVAPFTRGYGPTSLAPNNRYLIADLADDVLSLRDALDGDSRSVLIGHDWGAVAAWDVTERAPHAFARYVALAVPPTPAVLAPWRRLSTLRIALKQARLSWYFLYNQLPFAGRGLDRVIPKLWRDWSPGYDATEDLKYVFEALDTPSRRVAALRYYRNNLQGGAVRTFSVRPGAPALYLHGANDGCMLAAIADGARPMLAPGSDVDVLPGVGHFLHLENPSLVNERIASWIG